MRPTKCKASRPLGAVGLVLLALGGGGCSFAFPVISVSGEPERPPEPASTGSVVAKPPPVLASELNAEDWRRAHAALAVALDPHGNGKPVKWENPETKMRGAISPAAPPFVKNDEICRTFEAEVAGPDLAKDLRGTACRPSGGAWALKQVGPKMAPRPGPTRRG